MTWLPATGAIAVAVALVFIPGLLVTAALRLRGVHALALAGPIGLACIGVAGVLLGFTRVPFAWWSPLAVGALVALVVVGLFALPPLRAHRPPPFGSWAPLATLPVVAAAFVAAVAIGWIAFGAVPSPDRFSQTYDAVFHLNAAQSIVQTGDASSLHLYRLTHPGKNLAFYPAVWHSLVALVAEVTHVSIPAATNAAWIATAGPVWSLGSAFLAGTLFGWRRHGGAPSAVPALAALFSSAFVAFPYLLLDFGTLYPNGLAYTLLPTGLALIACALPWPAGAPWRPDAPPTTWRTWALVLAWCAAAALSHPRSVVGLAALGAPLVVWWFAARMRALAASGDRGRRRARLVTVLTVLGVLVALALAVVAVLHYYDVGKRPISDHLNGGPARAREPFGSALFQALLLSSLVSPGQSPLPVPIVLAALVLGGLVVLAMRPGLRWVPLSFAVVVLLYAAAAGSNSDLAKLATGLWDKDKFRIIALLPTIAVPVAAWAVVQLATSIVGAARRARLALPPSSIRAVVAVVTVIVLSASWFGGTLGGVRDAIGTVFALPQTKSESVLVDADQVALFERAAELVPQGQVVAGNPWNGSALLWALSGPTVLFPHLGGYWGTQRKLIARHLDDWRTDPEVCRAVRALNVHWVAANPTLFWGKSAQTRAFAGIDRAVQRGTGLTLVAKVGDSTLYRLTACWS